MRCVQSISQKKLMGKIMGKLVHLRREENRLPSVFCDRIKNSFDYEYIGLGV